MPTREELTPLWPLFGLTLTTPRLTLQPVCDDDLAELVELVRSGIHDPERMPFAVPWTDDPDIPANYLRYAWTQRAHSTTTNWSVLFGVRRRNELVGIQELTGEHFRITRTVGTGSWLGRRYQGQRVGTDMRAAVLLFAFDELGADRAESAAFTDNPASLRVSRKLGYADDGVRVLQRRPGERAVNQRLALSREAFRRPDWPLQVAGLDACRSEFDLPS